MGEEPIRVCDVGDMEYWYDVSDPGERRRIEAELRSRHGKVKCDVIPL